MAKIKSYFQKYKKPISVIIGLLIILNLSGSLILNITASEKHTISTWTTMMLPNAVVFQVVILFALLYILESTTLGVTSQVLKTIDKLLTLVLIARLGAGAFIGKLPIHETTRWFYQASFGALNDMIIAIVAVSVMVLIIFSTIDLIANINQDIKSQNNNAPEN